jgi:actin-like ATPase involved in cell morphogenesis
LAKDENLRQATGKGSGTSESQLNTILQAIAGVRESVDERFALVQEAITEVPDIGQMKGTISEEVRDNVREHLKNAIQREVVEAIGEEVKRTVQQHVSEVVRREVKSIVQREVMNIVNEQVTAIVQQQVTTIVQEQVTAILEKQLSIVQLSSPNLSYADVARTPPVSQASNLKTLSNETTPSTLTDTLYCTVDVSNVEEPHRGRANASTIRQEVEKEMREGEAGSGWRCVAVTRDPRNTARIRITCRNES